MSDRWTGWTDETIETAKRLWQEDKTALQIGEVIGASRSAIIAKMHRLGLAKGGVTSRPLDQSVLAARAAEVERVRREEENRQLMEAARIERERLEAEASAKIKEKLAEAFDSVLLEPLREPAETTVFVAPPEGVRFLDARERMCRFPLWGTHQSPPFDRKYVCGATTVAPTCSWCTKHLVVVADPIRKARYSNLAKS